MREVLRKEKNLQVELGHVEEVLTDSEGRVRGVLTKEGNKYLAPCVILATGTYPVSYTHLECENRGRPA